MAYEILLEKGLCGSILLGKCLCGSILPEKCLCGSILLGLDVVPESGTAGRSSSSGRTARSYRSCFALPSSLTPSAHPEQNEYAFALRDWSREVILRSPRVPFDPQNWV